LIMPAELQRIHSIVLDGALQRCFFYRVSALSGPRVAMPVEAAIRPAALGMRGPFIDTKLEERIRQALAAPGRAGLPKIAGAVWRRERGGPTHCEG
jgi:hypothetical protein